MGPGKPDYVYLLYEVYDMQEYLAVYASRLTQAVLLEGNAYYEEQLPNLTRLPFILGAIGLAVFLALLFSMRLFTGGILKAMAQLELLKSQMNPHFLFNTLNMITRMSQMEEGPSGFR